MVEYIHIYILLHFGYFITQSTSNLSQTSSSRNLISFFNKIKFLIFNLASCQLVRTNTQNESGNSTMFQLPLLNLTHQQQELSSHQSNSGLSNQSGTRGILKITAPSI